MLNQIAIRQNFNELIEETWTDLKFCFGENLFIYEDEYIETMQNAFEAAEIRPSQPYNQQDVAHWIGIDRVVFLMKTRHLTSYEAICIAAIHWLSFQLEDLLSELSEVEIYSAVNNYFTQKSVFKYSPPTVGSIKCQYVVSILIDAVKIYTSQKSETIECVDVFDFDESLARNIQDLNKRFSRLKI